MTHVCWAYCPVLVPAGALQVVVDRATRQSPAFGLQWTGLWLLCCAHWGLLGVHTRFCASDCSLMQRGNVSGMHGRGFVFFI
ncbi:hypothetical protein K461DRAFT_278652 [Myriangium duriaei CBS 260.36]|uniref:Uncharacterized protein n=1 Tax=Myriangium duriaei CBS 260.36 TaxID=1168546 RepID=A0A9P4J0J2_9PEZI|nr:hypothetical protein K461DRAFT_278652 [Myriangium duriaei CBS 260.36]